MTSVRKIPQHYNGYKVDDENNPSMEVWGRDVPAPELNEKRLSRIVRESVRKILNEHNQYPR